MTRIIETLVIVVLFFAEIIIIAFGMSSIFFLAYQDYSVTLWTRQNNNYSKLNVAYTPRNLAKIFEHASNVEMPSSRFNSVENRASLDYRCFNLHDSFKDGDDTHFKDEMTKIYDDETNKPPPSIEYSECTKANLEANAQACRITYKTDYLPFKKIPPAIPKLHWDIIIAGVVLVLSIMRNIVLATEYTAHSADKTSTNQMYGGLGVRAAVPQASYAYAPPGVFVMQ